jgi:hypothetical protein
MPGMRWVSFALVALSHASAFVPAKGFASTHVVPSMRPRCAALAPVLRRMRRAGAASRGTHGLHHSCNMASRKDGDGEAIVTEADESFADKLQVWLEDVYMEVDYEKALDAADLEQDPVFEGDDGGAELDEFTYGEMDLSFFLAIMRHLDPPSSAKFLDIGCGRGQLCLAAARARPWAACRGLEIIPEVLHIGRGAIEVCLQPKAACDVGWGCSPHPGHAAPLG